MSIPSSTLELGLDLDYDTDGTLLDGTLLYQLCTKFHNLGSIVLSIALAEPYRGLLRSCSCGERDRYTTDYYYLVL